MESDGAVSAETGAGDTTGSRLQSHCAGGGGVAGALRETVLRGLKMRRLRGLGDKYTRGGAARACLDPSAPRPRVAPTGRWRPRARHVSLTPPLSASSLGGGGGLGLLNRSESVGCVFHTRNLLVPSLFLLHEFAARDLVG